MPAGILHRDAAVLGRRGPRRGRPHRACDDLAGAAALAAGARDDEEALLIAQLARAAALRARLRATCPRRAPDPLHVSHASSRGIWIVVSAAAERLLERDLEVEAQIGAARRARAPSPPPPKPKKSPRMSEKSAKMSGLNAGPGAGRAGDAGVAEPIVPRALVGVAEHRVRLGGFLEPFLGRRDRRGCDRDGA